MDYCAHPAAPQNEGSEMCPAFYVVNALTQQISLILMGLRPERSMDSELDPGLVSNRGDERLPWCLVLWRRDRP